MDGGSGAFMNTFTPEADARAFRTALGRFATGVTIVTVPSPEGPVGMTANSFASVSLDPALVLWSPAKSSSRFHHFVDAPYFAIHVLASEQRDLCAAFARSKSAFDRADWTISDHDVPLLNGCLARFECTLDAAHDAGDHAILVGRVTQASARDGSPLVFSSGQYGRFTHGH